MLDNYTYGKKLKEGVCNYIKHYPKQSQEEKEQAIKWCEKMLLRLEREDAEGYFRGHWLVVDSLEIYFNLCDEYYYGPKKSIYKMKQSNYKAYALYYKALAELNVNALSGWIKYLRELIAK